MSKHDVIFKNWKLPLTYQKIFAGDFTLPPVLCLFPLHLCSWMPLGSVRRPTYFTKPPLILPFSSSDRYAVLSESFGPESVGACVRGWVCVWLSYICAICWFVECLESPPWQQWDRASACVCRSKYWLHLLPIFVLPVFSLCTHFIQDAVLALGEVGECLPADLQTWRNFLILLPLFAFCCDTSSS